MIAFQPVPPDEANVSCSSCEQERSRFFTNSAWDTILGRFTQLNEDDNGNPLLDSELGFGHVNHFYCYLMMRPGNARIRFGILDAKVAIYSHESQTWEPVLMTERGFRPICSGCNTTIHPEERVAITGEPTWTGEIHEIWVHKQCVTLCLHCEKKTLHGRRVIIESLQDDDSSWVGCRECYRIACRNEEFFDCTWCGNTRMNDDLAWEDNSYRTCSLCEERISTCDDCGSYYETDGERHYHEVIQDYASHPRPRFYPDGKQLYYLGYELEVEVDEDDDKYGIAEDLLRAVNQSVTDSKYVYLKEDGSLEHGFEIVTHPFTLEYHQQFDLSFLERLSSHGVRSWDRDTCGFHVHVSRSAFTIRQENSEMRRYNKAHELRFTSLIYLNRDKFTRFAGRESNDYASFYSDDDNSVSAHVLRKAKGREGTRFQAVNVQNSNTIEVRIFRGSLKKERVLANLELVHACVEYTRWPTESVIKSFKSADDNAFRWNRFRSWLIANEKIYPHVNHYLTQLSL
jgi:hypothetical protein